ncbi:MAG TPA: hypothetical protein EYQ81_08790 [Sneathiellales bacterium]|nr:hypothetical protein [Sneathiellales bacterium]
MTTASLYVSLLVVDLAAVFLLTPPPAEHRGLYQKDAARGHAHVPRFNGDVRTSAKFAVSINGHGYRDHEWRFDVQRRLLVVGDSFTFGEPLAVEVSTVGQLQHLSRDGPIRYYNAGVSGYGLAHVLETVSKECPVVRPERVIYLYYFNDTRWDGLIVDSTTVVDGWMVPTMDRADRTRRLSQAQIREHIAEAMAQRSFSMSDWFSLANVVNFLRRRGILPLDGETASTASSDSPLLSTDTEAYPPDLSIRAAEILRAIAGSARSCGAAFTMAILPTDWEARLGIKEPATERLLASLANDNLDILDLRQQAEPGRVLRLPNDNHYNPDAAAWAAQRIAKHLEEVAGKAR